MTPPRPEFLTGSRLRPEIPHGVGGFGSGSVANSAMV